MTTKRVMAVLVVLMLAVASLTLMAQGQGQPTPPVDPNATPSLTENEKTQLENVQLQLLVAERDFIISQYKFEVAQKRVVAFIDSKARQGWTLDRRTGNYMKNP